MVLFHFPPGKHSSQGLEFTSLVAKAKLQKHEQQPEEYIRKWAKAA